jgi:hypothetical protein
VIHYLGNTLHRKGLGGMAPSVGPEFKSQYRKKENYFNKGTGA